MNKAAPEAKGNSRITRADQAWGPAHREYEERLQAERVADIAEAWDQAYHELIVRAEHGRICDVDEAFDLATREDISRDNQKYARLHRATIGHKGEVALVEDMPVIAPMDAGEPVQTIVLPFKLISSALIVAAKGDVRYYLNAVYIHSVDGEIRICSTDGHRLLVSRFAPGKDVPIPAWCEEGLLIPRDELAQVLPMLSKNSLVFSHAAHEPSIVVDYAKGAPALQLRSPNGFVQFRLKPIDAKFPDYARVMAANGATLARSSNEALTASAINATYLKSVGDIAQKIGANAVHPFVNGDDKSAMFFTFDGAPDTVLVVMPVRTDTGGVSEGVARIVGRGALELSLAAMRAHATRTKRLMLEAKGEREREDLEAKHQGYEDRIAQLLAATASGPKQLESPKQA